MAQELLDFRYLLIENYKKLKLDEKQLATIFIIDHYINQGNKMITADLLSLKMSMPVKEIDHILSSLLKMHYIDYVEENNKIVTTLEPLKELLYREFEISFNNDRKISTKIKNSKEVANIYQQFEQYLNRTLTPIEISKINEWINIGYDTDTIIGALKEAISKNKKSLRSVDKILLVWTSRDDIEKEGHTVVNENWRNSIEETIKIAKTPWVKKDDDQED